MNSLTIDIASPKIWLTLLQGPFGARFLRGIVQQSQYRHRFLPSGKLFEPVLSKSQCERQDLQYLPGQPRHRAVVLVHHRPKLLWVANRIRVLVRAHIEFLAHHCRVIARQVAAEVESLFQIPWAALFEGLRADRLVATVVGA